MNLGKSSHATSRVAKPDPGHPMLSSCQSGQADATGTQMVYLPWRHVLCPLRLAAPREGNLFTMVSIPESHADLFVRPVVVGLATVQPDGQPQVTPIWADLEDGLIRINTSVGRQKWKNLTERPQATVLAIDPENPFNWIEVRGTVARHTEENGNEVINALSHKYTGQDYQGFVEGEIRVTFYIQPSRIATSG